MTEKSRGSSSGGVRVASSILFWLGIVVVFVAPVGLILYGKSEAGWVSLVCGVILLVASRFADIEELSIGPLKTKLVRQIQEAEQALEAVRALTAKTAETSLSLVKMSGRLGGFSDEQEEEILSSFRQLMNELGVDDATKDRAEAFWHQTVEYDYGHLALGGNQVPQDADPEESREWKLLRRGGFEERPRPEAIEAFLNRTGYMNETSKEFLEDLNYYIENRQHRRPEFWKEREEHMYRFRLTRDKRKDD